MSGRSGYRKTDRKRNWRARPRPKADYVLRFQLPPILAAFLAPGPAGIGVTIGFNDVVFVAGFNPAHCCQLAAEFLDRLGSRNQPQFILAHVIKLLPCSAHCAPAGDGIFKKLTIDVEALHDRVSRFKDTARSVSIDIGAEAITFTGREGFAFRIVHNYREGGDRRQAR